MNAEMYLRCWLEFAILIPCAVMALLPVRHELRFQPLRVCILSAASVLALSLAGAALCVSRHWATNTVLLPLLPVFFCLYCYAVQLRFVKSFSAFSTRSCWARSAPCISTFSSRLWKSTTPILILPFPPV